MTTRDPFVAATSAVLGGAAVLHLGWGLRVQLPGLDSAKVADAVVGSPHLPPPAACFAVATALAAAAALVAGVPAGRRRARRIGQTGVATVLAGRGLVGLLGAFDVVAPGPTSARFQKWDRRLYTPLCLALSAGAARSALR